MRKYMYLISILILSSCQVADVQNGTEKKDNFLQEVGRLSDFVLSQSKVGGYLSEEDAVILDNWLKELSTKVQFWMEPTGSSGPFTLRSQKSKGSLLPPC